MWFIRLFVHSFRNDWRIKNGGVVRCRDSILYFEADVLSMAARASEPCNGAIDLDILKITIIPVWHDDFQETVVNFDCVNKIEHPHLTLAYPTYHISRSPSWYAPSLSRLLPPIPTWLAPHASHTYLAYPIPCPSLTNQDAPRFTGPHTPKSTRPPQVTIEIHSKWIVVAVVATKGNAWNTLEVQSWNVVCAYFWQNANAAIAIQEAESQQGAYKGCRSLEYLETILIRASFIRWLRRNFSYFFH